MVQRKDDRRRGSKVLVRNADRSKTGSSISNDARLSSSAATIKTAASKIDEKVPDKGRQFLEEILEAAEPDQEAISTSSVDGKHFFLTWNFSYKTEDVDIQVDAMERCLNRIVKLKPPAEDYFKTIFGIQTLKLEQGQLIRKYFSTEIPEDVDLASVQIKKDEQRLSVWVFN